MKSSSRCCAQSLQCICYRVVRKINYNVCRTFWCISGCHLLNHTLFSHSQPQIQPRSLVQGHTAPRSVPSLSNPRLPTHLVSATRSTPAHSSLRSQNREQPPVHNLFSCFVLIFCIYTCQRYVCWLAAFNLPVL